MSFTEAQKAAIQVLEGLCVTSKSAPTITQLLQEYEEFEGQTFDTTGFKSPTEMLQMSEKFVLIPREGTMIVNSKTNYENIQSIIDRQQKCDVQAPNNKSPKVSLRN